MGLYLRAQELERIAATADVLATPLAYGSHAAWVAAAADSLRDLLGGEAALVCGAALGVPGVWSSELAPAILERFRDYMAPSSDVLHSNDASYDAALARRRAARLDIWSMEDVRAMVGTRFEDLPIYNDVTAPSRLLHAFGFATANQAGEGHFAVLSSTDDSWRFGENTRNVMRLLLPALSLGGAVRARLPDASEAHRWAQRRLRGTAILDRTGGRFLAPTDGLAKIVEATGDVPTVLRALRDAARAVVQTAHPRRSGVRCGEPTVLRELQLTSGMVEILATWLGDLGGSTQGGVLVSVRAAERGLPSPREVIARFALTRREADVALLLAAGQSRAQIAETLTLSPHTVRHHTEAVFRKLNVHARSAVAMALLEIG